MECMGWHMETHHRNNNQEHFLHWVILQGKTVIWVFELRGVYTLEPLTEVDIYPTINGLTSLGKGVAFLIILIKKVVRSEIQTQSAGKQGLFLFATDRLLLEGVLEAMDGGRARPLSANPEFQLAVRGQTGRDVLAYAAAQRLLGSIERSLPDHERDEFNAAMAVLRLRELVCGACGQGTCDELVVFWISGVGRQSPILS